MLSGPSKTRVTATNVGVDACKPHLLNVLWITVIRFAEAIVHEGLRVVPAMQTKHPAALIERDGQKVGIPDLCRQ
jgi:hypothetical protein